MGKRANGEGTIGKYKNGQRAVISYKTINGESKEKPYMEKLKEKLKEKVSNLKEA